MSEGIEVEVGVAEVAPVEEVATEAVTEVAEVAEVAEVTASTPATDEAFADSWLNGLEDEELKGDKTLERLKGKSADEVARYVKELQAWNGKKGDIPADNATPEEKEAFAIKMGRPETKEGYDFNLNEDFTKLVGEENAPLYQGMVDGFKDTALEVGLSTDQAAKIMEYYLSSAAEDITGVGEVATKHQAEAQATIDKEWGESKQHMEGAINAMLTKAGADVEALKATGALSDPNIAIALGKIASDLADDPEIGHHMTRTVTGVQDQLAEVNAETKAFIARGDRVPAHLKSKRVSLMAKLGNDL